MILFSYKVMLGVYKQVSLNGVPRRQKKNIKSDLEGAQGLPGLPF